MSDDACMGCLGAICGACCIGITSSLSAWCNTKTYGGGNGSSGSGSGCCGSCCSKSFDDDNFDNEIRKDMEKTRDPNASPPVGTSTQPVANQGMVVPAGNESSEPKDTPKD